MTSNFAGTLLIAYCRRQRCVTLRLIVAEYCFSRQRESNTAAGRASKRYAFSRSMAFNAIPPSLLSDFYGVRRTIVLLADHVKSRASKKKKKKEKKERSRSPANTRTLFPKFSPGIFGLFYYLRVTDCFSFPVIDGFVVSFFKRRRIDLSTRGFLLFPFRFFSFFL